MRWLVVFATAAFAGITLIMLVVAAFGWFEALGLSTPGVVALWVGIILTSALGVGLMALVFYSDRSNVDEEVYHPKLGEPDERE